MSACVELSEQIERMAAGKLENMMWSWGYAQLCRQWGWRQAEIKNMNWGQWHAELYRQWGWRQAEMKTIKWGQWYMHNCACSGDGGRQKLRTWNEDGGMQNCAGSKDGRQKWRPWSEDSGVQNCAGSEDGRQKWRTRSEDRMAAGKTVQAVRMAVGRNDEHKVRTVACRIIQGGAWVAAGRSEEHEVKTVTSRFVQEVRMRPVFVI